jgi:hypothetical protein
MDQDDEWLRFSKERSSRMSDAGCSLLRVVLLFGFVAGAFGLILVPVVDEQARSYGALQRSAASIDPMVTGQIERSRAAPPHAGIEVVPDFLRCAPPRAPAHPSDC